MLTDTDILEASTGDVKELTGRRYKVRLIEGDRLGSTGYYPAETIRRDGPKVFLKGTPMYLDHISPEDTKRGSFGSIANYAGELAEDAYYVENDGLYADIEVFENHMPTIKALKDRIGISIRARGRTETQTINGKSVPVFKELLLARSADFVVKAGAGGKIVDVLESGTDTLNSENHSEAEEGIENMDEVLKELKSMRTDLDARFTELAESLRAEIATIEPEVESQESAVDVETRALEIAEAFVSSTLDADGRQRVLDLHRANKKPLAELIEAEEAYVKKNVVTNSAAEGVEEEAAESAKATEIHVPSAWNKNKKVN